MLQLNEILSNEKIMSAKIELGLHTVIILVGPSQAGKSTWSHMFQEKIKDIDENLRCPIISSDELRQEILGANYHRNDKRMLGASSQAFDLIRAKLKAFISFPVNNEFVIVDTTGMDSEF